MAAPAATQAAPVVTPTSQIPCEKAGCDKVYKARGSMMTHMRQKHNQDSAQIPSPLGSFPPASKATVLQFDDTEDATQRNSNGGVNSPKVVSKATFICTVCDIHFPMKEDVIKHMDETHVTHATPSNDNTFICDICETDFQSKEDVTKHNTEEHESADVNSFICNECQQDFNSKEAFSKHKNEVHINPLDVEAEVLEEAKEDQDLYDMLENMFNESSTNSEVRDEKIKRFTTILSRKNTTLKETLSLVSNMKTELDGLKHDAELREQVLEKQTKELEDKQKEKEALCKDVKNQRERNKDVLINEKVKKMENDRLKGENKFYLKEIETLRENVGSLTKENTDLNIKVNAKQELVRGLKEALGIEEAEEEENIEVVEFNTPSVVMNNNTNAQKCNACDKKFRRSSDLENHIGSKHTEKSCIYCDEVCNNEVELIKHHKDCNAIGEANRVCNKCDQVFTRNGLRRHTPTCHGPNKEYDCSECGQIFTTDNDVKEHEANDHKMERVKSRVVCKHWRKGSCLKGTSCNFSHVGHQNAITNDSSRVPTCRNGPKCDWLSKGNCSYFHPRVGVQKPWTQPRRQDADRLAGTQGSQQDGARAQSGRQGGRQEAARGQGGRQETGRGWQEATRGRKGAARGRQEAARGRQDTAMGQGSQQSARSLIQPDRLRCRFDGRCERIPNCPWIHSMEDFPPLQGRSNNMLRNNTQQRRH